MWTHASSLISKSPDAAVAACLAQSGGRLATSNFVFNETVTLVRYRLGYRAARAFGDALQAGGLTPVLRVTPGDEAAAWEIFTRYRDKSFSFTDCTNFALMERLRIGSSVRLTTTSGHSGYLACRKSDDIRRVIPVGATP